MLNAELVSGRNERDIVVELLGGVQVFHVNRNGRVSEPTESR